MLLSNRGNTIVWQQCMSVTEDYSWPGYGVGSVDHADTYIIDVAGVVVNM